MSDKIEVTSLPNLSEMTDAEIEAYAQTLWDKLEKPQMPATIIKP